MPARRFWPVAAGPAWLMLGQTLVRFRVTGHEGIRRFRVDQKAAWIDLPFAQKICFPLIADW